MKNIDLTRTIIQKTRENPAWFSRNILQEDLWWMQDDILRSVFENARTGVKSCNSGGKTRVAANAVLAFLHAYPMCKIITTAPSWTQVSKLLWGDIALLYGKLPKVMGFQLYATELRANTNWWAIGLSTDEGVRFLGHHAPKMLIIIDEGQGVAHDIYEAINSLRAGGDVHLLVLGNPFTSSGDFKEIFTEKSEGWNLFTIDGLLTPNIVGISEQQLLELKLPENPNFDNIKPYLITKQWIQERMIEWGIDSPFYQAYVRGQFPDQTEDTLIPSSYLEAARARPSEFVTPDEDNSIYEFPLHMGIDVSGPGKDETVLYTRQRSNIIDLSVFVSLDPTDEVIEYIKRFPRFRREINIDSIGIGYYFAQKIKSEFENDPNVLVHEINVSEKCDMESDQEKYRSQKAWAYWRLRERFRTNDIQGLVDKTTFAQLSTLRYEIVAKGKIDIEDKKSMKRRGLKSPDRAEALMLAFVQPDPPIDFGNTPPPTRADERQSRRMFRR